MVNMTCPVIPDKPEDPKPFFQNGQIDFKAHDVGWLICGIMALIATISSVWLIWKHLTYYTCPPQQRHIVRLLVMVPIYAIVSFMSYLFYEEALYYQTIRDCYEAVLVTSFFYLILAYTGDTRAEQHAVFRNIEVKDRFWVWPLGSWKYKPDGLHFLWLMKIYVLQYAIIRPLCTFIAVGTEYFGYYCLHSWMPWFTHVWCALFISVSVTLAMYCLIQLYMPVKKLVDPYKPILKFLSIKTIVFLTFWQDVLLSFLVSFGAIKETEYFTAEQIQAGINALLQCFWMLLFGFIHIKAFSYLPYRPEDRSRTTRRGKALLDSLDFRDWFFEMKESTRYIAARSKGRNYTLAEDLRAKRHEHLLNAFGKQRTANLEIEVDMEKAAMPTFWKNPEDAKLWTPTSDVSDSPRSSYKHRTNLTIEDVYTPITKLDGRNGARQGSSLAEKPPTAPVADSHTQRAAELERLVAELDLQEADRTIAETEEHGYDYEDEKYERAALMRAHLPTSFEERKGPNQPTVENDQHPELTQYHVATIQLANVPSLTYDQDTPSSNLKGTRELYAVAEEDEQLTHAHQSTKVSPGIGAFGIASWFGWNNDGNSNESQQRQQPSRHLGIAHASSSADGYLRPGEAYHADVEPHSPGQRGTEWWRSYWERVSNAGSREPSVAGIEEEEEKEPLTTTRSVVMRQVAAGSWGIQNVDQHNSQAMAGENARTLHTLPALTIETGTPPYCHDDGQGSIDSTTSPSSLISPHVDSPLSRLIQTSRDSVSSLNREEVRILHLEPSLSTPLPKNSEMPQSAQEQPLTVTGSSFCADAHPTPAPRNPSFTASSKQASVSRVTSTTTRSGAATTQKSLTTPSTAQLASEILSNHDSRMSSKHPIVFADALFANPSNAEHDTAIPPAVTTKKTLAPAVGPKGKLFNLILPSPLSPARYPYGKEGDPSQTTSTTVASNAAVRQQDDAAKPDEMPQRQHGRSSDGGNGTVKWANQPSKPVRSSAEPSFVNTITKLPQGKSVVTVGSMSLAQAKAAQEQAAADAGAHSVQLQPTSLNGQLLSSTSPGAVTRVPKTILLESKASKSYGKLLLPAPSRLANIGMSGGEAEDPYLAGRSATIDTTAERNRRRVSEPMRGAASGSVVASSSAQTRTSMSTAFEVGSIVPREAVVRASLPSKGPLRGYHDSFGLSQQNEFKGHSGAREQDWSLSPMQRHSFAPMTSGPRPAMLPSHPSQSLPQEYCQPHTSRPGHGSIPHLQQQQALQLHSQHHHLPSRLPQQPHPSSYYSQAPTQSRYPHAPMPPQSRPQYPHASPPQPSSQFHYEYYRD